MKQRRSNIGQVGVDHDEMPAIEGPFSQVLNPTQVASASTSETLVERVDKDNSDSDSNSDSECIGHTNDSGEDSKFVELRRHARKFKKRMRDTKSLIGRDATGPLPTDLIANLEEHIEREEMDWNYDSSDEDYSYDED
ncbi:RING-type E3 ubiquitin transferase [Hordeum vulgare]|nr:RING-type E3 ubiquitin transferase [Hordeum vulgare]